MLHQEIKEKNSLRMGYLIFTLVFFVYIMVCMTRTCFNAATAQVVKEGLMTKSQTGLISTLFYLVYSILQIPGGMLADRIKPIKLILLGIIGAFISNTVIYLNNSYGVMLTFWTINGLCQMGFWPAILKILASEVISENIKNSRFIFSTSTAIGYSLSYLVGAMVKKWQDNFLVSAIMMAVLFALIVLFSRGLDAVSKDNTKLKANEKKTEKQKYNMLNIFLKSGFLLTAPAIFLWTLVKTGTAALMSTMLIECYENVSSSFGNIITSVSVLSGILGVLMVKVLLDKFKKLNQLTVFEICFILLLPFWFFMTKIGEVNFWLAAFSLYLTQILCATGQLIINIDYVLVYSKFGKEATVAGVVNAVSSFAFVFANYGCAKIADAFGWKIFCTSVFAMIIIINVLLICVLPIWKKFLKDLLK